MRLMAVFFVLAAALWGGCGERREYDEPAKIALERELEQVRQLSDDEAHKHFGLAAVYRKYGLHD
jgi:hypothetical protein